MTDQLPKPAIGNKLFFSSMNLERHDPQWFNRWLWLHYKEVNDRLVYLTLTCVTAYYHSITCLEQTGFSKSILWSFVCGFSFLNGWEHILILML